MPRLALMSPWPPQPSGVASCTADLVPRLAVAGHGVDVFVDEARVPVSPVSDRPPQPGVVRVIGAHEFVWRQARGHYDLPIYQLGNSRSHGFVWPYLFGWPGLTVLHDARLHHARANVLLAGHRHAHYRAEFAYNHPDVPRDAAELAIAGFNGAYYYQWPMRRAVVDASRVTACHSAGMARLLRAQHPLCAVEYVALGHGRARSDEDIASARLRFRRAQGIPDGALVCGVLGTAAVEKRIVPLVKAFAAVRRWSPDARLLVVGHVDSQLPLGALLDSFGLHAVAHAVGRVDDAAFDDAVAACDVGLNLRWPTAREVSGPWLRMLAAGVPTVIMDSIHQSDLSTLDPRTWRLREPRVGCDAAAEPSAIAVGIDVLDEDHSLRLALRRLVADEDLRHQIGAAGRRHWSLHHTVEKMTEDFERVIALALCRPSPDVLLPEHLRPDPFAHAAQVVQRIVGESDRAS